VQATQSDHGPIPVLDVGSIAATRKYTTADDFSPSDLYLAFVVGTAGE
jgi:hypothetical protein